MKISKVNHTHFGVGTKENRSRGMLYNNPSQNSKVVLNDDDLEKWVDSLNKSAKILYSVFNPYKLDTEGMENEEKQNAEAKVARMKKVGTDFKTVFVKIVNITDRNKQIMIFRDLPNQKFYVNNRDVKGSSFNIDWGNNDAREEIREYIDQCLKKSFCVIRKRKNGEDIVLKDTMVNLILAMSDQKNFKLHITKVTDEELLLFLDILDKDYNKKKQCKDIINSIKNKNTIVKVVTKDGVNRLAPSFFGNRKKGALFDYMIKYAEAGTVEKREELRREKSQFAWNYLLSGNSDGTVFSEQIENVLCLIANTENQRDRVKLEEKALDLVNKEIVCKYNEVRSTLADTDMQSLYWLNFFSEETAKWVRKSIRKRKGLSSRVSGRRLLLRDIHNHLNKYFYSFMAMKFVDLGKAVYHFTDYKSSHVGEILDEFAGGITSFDYERISAEDNVKRDLVTYVSFAANNFAASICDNNTLQEKDDVLDKSAQIRDGAKRNILRYFGGISEWSELEQIDEKKFAETFREHIAAIRNHIIHFDADFSENRSNTHRELIQSIFDEEYSRLSLVYAKKYYSNNLPMFYEKDELYHLINDTLYHNQKLIAAGIPAFSRIVTRSKIEEFLNFWIGNKSLKSVKSGGRSNYQKYQAAMFFVLKEIYYYGFLMDEGMIGFMDKALELIQKEAKVESDAIKNYQKRFKDLKDAHLSAPEICEQIVLDMALQNQNIKVVKTKENSDKIKEIYQHFRMILYRQLKRAFVLYLNFYKEEYAFLKNPKLTNAMDTLTAEEFSNHIQIKVFEPVKNAIYDSDSAKLLSWYVTAHFMSKRQLNHLCGSIHTELRYLKDVDRRAKSTNNRQSSDTAQKVCEYEAILRIFEYTMNYCDQCSNRITDYFEDEDDYANMLSFFIDFTSRKKEDVADKSPATILKEFCSMKIISSKTNKIGLYYDAENPIVNRNVMRACMYGSQVWLSKGILKKIEYKDIMDYYRYWAQSEKIENSMDQRTKKEQETIRTFQNLKNRIELTDIATYVDIINDLYGQLLSWVYLRERDLTYMQLGFYYTKLMWGKSVEKSDKLRRLNVRDREIENGAVLYMIRAMYSHDLPMPKAEAKTGIGNFLKIYSEAEYCAGLELFENIGAKDDSIHSEMTGLRNYIAHFKYFSKTDHSIEELFGDIFSEFFDYSDNLHKSIPVVYKNLLAQYKVIVDLKIAESESTNYSPVRKRDYQRAKFVIKPDWTDERGENHKCIDSDTLSFKVVNEKSDSISLPAHDEVFLENVRALLTYKKKPE